MQEVNFYLKTMKKAFAMILIIFLEFPLMSQVHKKFNPNFQIGIDAFEHQNIRGIDIFHYYPTGNVLESQSKLKSSQIIKQRMDSMLYEEYNPLSSQFVVYYKQEYKYNSVGENTQIIYFELDLNTQTLVSKYKDEITNNNGEYCVVFSYKSVNQWFDNEKCVQSYNAIGKLEKIIVCKWA